MVRGPVLVVLHLCVAVTLVPTAQGSDTVTHTEPRQHRHGQVRATASSQPEVSESPGTSVTINIKTDRAIAETSAGFVAMGWEMYAMLGQMDDMKDETFTRAASHLSPAVVRVGGITADWVRYTGFDTPVNARLNDPDASASESDTSASSESVLPHRPPLMGYWPTEERNLTLDDFTVLFNFMKAAKLSLMFDLNELHGRSCQNPSPTCPHSTNPYCNAWCTGSWDMSNVEVFLQYLHDHYMVGGDSPLFAFEVGNELISHEYASNTTADMVVLAKLIQRIWSDVPSAQRPGLYGPSTDACQDAGQLEILKNISNVPGIAGFTFHA